MPRNRGPVHAGGRAHACLIFPTPAESLKHRRVGQGRRRAAAGRGRDGARGAATAARSGGRRPAPGAMAPVRNPYPPFEILSADQVEAIHHASLRVLAEVGVNFCSTSARDPEGGRLRGRGVRHPGALRSGLRRGADPERARRFTLHARNPGAASGSARTRSSSAMVASTPNVSDLEGGRRTGSFADYLQPHQARPRPQHRAHDRGLSGRAGRPAARDPPPGCRGRRWRRSATAALRLRARRGAGSATRSRSPGSRARRATSSCCASPP